MSDPNRIDEIEKFYRPIEKSQRTSDVLFWALVAISFALLFTKQFSEQATGILIIVFLTVAVVSFALSAYTKFFLIPDAERARRKQNLSDALATGLAHLNTNLYYNNGYKKSFLKLGANTFENSLFSKETATKMLIRKRMVLGGYFLSWLVILLVRSSDLELITWITQLLFSGEIIASHISLELLRYRHQAVFERFYDFFRHQVGEESQEGIATIIDIFSEYESAKSAAGIKLDSKIFETLNPALSEEWEAIRRNLEMDA